MLHNVFSVNFLSRPNSIQYPGHFLFRVFNSRQYTLSWLETLRDGNPFYFPVLNYHISVSIWNSAKRGHFTRAEQECCIMTD